MDRILLAIKNRLIMEKTERLKYQEYYERLSKGREQFQKELREKLCKSLVYDVYWCMKNIFYKAIFDYTPKQDYLSVLDIDCGKGEDLLNISKRKKIIGYGLDWSLNQLKIAKHSMNFSFIQADAENLPFRDSAFDLVISSELIEHLLNPRAFIQEALRIIQPEGRILITTPNKYNYFTLLGKIFPVRIRKRLSKAIRGKLDIDSSEYSDGDIKEHLYEFSPGKLKYLLSQRGFIIKTVLGSVLSIPFPRLFEKLPLFYKLLFYINRFIDRLPFSNYLKAHIIIVAEKPS